MSKVGWAADRDRIRGAGPATAHKEPGFLLQYLFGFRLQVFVSTSCAPLFWISLARFFWISFATCLRSKSITL